MLPAEKELVMGIARDIYIENLRKGITAGNVFVFANTVKAVKEGLEILDKGTE